MRWERISAIVLHAWYHFRHSRETWIDVFWFPVINAIVIAGLSLYAGASGIPVVTFTALAVILWYVIEMGTYSIAVGVLWEVWARSFSNLFTSPLTITEFVVGQIIFSCFKQVLLLVVVSLLIWSIFHFTILVFGWVLPLYIALLMAYGWAFGMFVFGLILRFGTNIQSLAWGLVFILQPVVGIFYPVGLLPSWLQAVVYLLGPTYVFESARAQIMGGQPLWGYLSLAAVVDVISLAATYLFMRYMWQWARISGALARMEQ